MSESEKQHIFTIYFGAYLSKNFSFSFTKYACTSYIRGHVSITVVVFKKFI